MKESTIQILSAEYDRLRALEQYRLESHGHILQLYVGVITAATGALILLWEIQVSPSSFQLNASLLLGITLLVGEITYLRVLGVDMELARIAEAYQLVRDKFIQADPELADAFPTGLIHDAKKYRYWSSISGILVRVFTVSGPKTTVVLLNCVVSAGTAIIIVWPRTIWVALVVGVGVAVLVAFLHVVHAFWRYRLRNKQLPDAAGWWI